MAFHTAHRELLHTGRTVNADHHDDATWVHGTVAQDFSEALFQIAALTRSATTGPHRVRLPGLDPDRRYRVTLEQPGAQPLTHGRGVVPWAVDGITLTGRALAETGLPMQPMHPEHSQIWRVVQA